MCESQTLRLDNAFTVMFVICCTVQTRSGAPFTEENLQPDTGTPRRLALANDVLISFRDWANNSLAPTIHYDAALMFTA